MKQNLPAICFSGTFSKRSDDALIEHSGIICLDFDGYPTKKSMFEDKANFMEDAYTLSVFVSPSGNGLKVLVKIPAEADNHKRYFEALKDHFDSRYFDVTSKNISRVCYESYDPEIYYNADSDVWTVAADYSNKTISRNDISLPVSDENKIIDILLKWWTKEFPMVSGQRNNNAFVLAAALNEYGIPRSLAEYVLSQYSSSDFPLSEIKTTIESAYRNVSAHNTKFFEDEETMSNVRRRIRSGESEDKIKRDLLNKNLDKDLVETVIHELENNTDVNKFWVRSEKGSISIVHYLYKEFLQHHGFYKFAPHDSLKYQFVKVTNNLIDRTTEEEIKDFVLGYLENMEDLSIYNFFADKTRFFKEDFLSLLDTVDVHFVEDTKEYSHIYFRNCAIKVEAEQITTVDYVDLDGFVWKDQVIDRDFEFCDVTDCDFKKFISNIAGEDDRKIESLKSTIGFLMSGYKDPGFCPSVILNDEVITENPEGGTGKGLFVQGISMMKKVAMIDGKSFSFEKPFAYQTISTDTQVISFDDVKKHFDFERLFSAITEGLTIEKKNKDAIRIPFRYSPKIVITTNYAIRGKGNSFERRKWELELKQYYNKDFTPVDEFGKRLFDEWDEDEWCSFDNFMVQNLQFYLQRGLVKSEFKNIGIRRLASETCHEFIDWMGLVDGSKPNDILEYNKKIFKDDFYLDFIKHNPDFGPKAKMTISRNAFYKWLHSYGQFKQGIEVIEGRDGAGRWIMFKRDEEAKNVQLSIPT